MCGRFSLFFPLNVVEERFDARFEAPYERRYNAAPSQSLPVIRDVDPDSIVNAEWGLQPAWAATRVEAGFVNARAETATEKRSFSAALAGIDSSTGEGAGAAGRCLVPADGFYEWTAADDGRQPYRSRRPDGELFAMAGLWTRWRPERRQSSLPEFGGGSATDDATVETFAILTTTANQAVAAVHDRMPVVLSPDEEESWLTADGNGARTLLEPYDGAMEVYAVSDAVNDPANDDPSVVEPTSG